MADDPQPVGAASAEPVRSAPELPAPDADTEVASIAREAAAEAARPRRKLVKKRLKKRGHGSWHEQQGCEDAVQMSEAAGSEGGRPKIGHHRRKKKAVRKARQVDGTDGAEAATGGDAAAGLEDRSAKKKKKRRKKKAVDEPQSSVKPTARAGCDVAAGVLAVAADAVEGDSAAKEQTQTTGAVAEAPGGSADALEGDVAKEKQAEEPEVAAAGSPTAAAGTAERDALKTSQAEDGIVEAPAEAEGTAEQVAAEVGQMKQQEEPAAADTPAPMESADAHGEAVLKRRKKKKKVQGIGEHLEAEHVSAQDQDEGQEDAAAKAPSAVDGDDDEEVQKRRKKKRRLQTADDAPAGEEAAEQGDPIAKEALDEDGEVAAKPSRKKRRIRSSGEQGAMEEGAQQELERAEGQDGTAEAPAICADAEGTSVAKKRKKKREPYTWGDELGAEDGAWQEEQAEAEEALEEVGESAPRARKKKKRPRPCLPQPEGVPQSLGPAQEEQQPEAEPQKRKKGTKKKKRRAQWEQGEQEHLEGEEAAGEGDAELEHAQADGGEADGDACGVDDASTPPCLKVCAANLPTSLDKDGVCKVFEQCGQVESLFLVRDWWTQESRGVCFITFADQAGVQAALEYDGKELEGKEQDRKAIRVNIAKDRDSTKGKGGGRGASGAGRGSTDWQTGSSGRGYGRGYGKGKAKGRGSSAAACLALSSQAPEGCRGLVVKGLDFGATEEDLREIFGKCGDGPTRVRILKDKRTGESKGKAFVDFADTATVEEAVRLNGTSSPKGWPLWLEFAKSQGA